MAKETVSAQTSDSEAVEFEYEFGDTLQEMCDNFGTEVVTAYAKRGLVVAAQGHARGHIKQAKTADQIREAMAQWKPGLPRQPKSAEEKAREMLDSLSPEARAQLLKDLKKAS